jgi:DNA-binding NtrC family response regulator
MTARPGLLETASGGTLFLDEVGDLPLALQAKLLRVLEERKLMRVGARQPRDIDVRFVFATNRDLDAAVIDGSFRQDLYFRMNGIALSIPPLRERPSEIEPLARLFAGAVSKQLGRTAPPALSDELLAALKRYAWPGNVRELKNIIDRAIVLCLGATVTVEHLPPKLLAASSAKPAAPPSSAGAAPDAGADLAALERQRIIDALEACAGNQTRAAELLGVSRRTLTTWLERHQLPRPRKPSG